MHWKVLILGLLLAAAVAEDIRYYKVGNRTIIAGLAAGLLTYLALDGWTGVLSSAAAALIPALLLMVLFALRMLGAGDIKLFCAAGSIMGPVFLLPAMAFSFLAGGILALGIMLVRGNLKERLHHIAAWLRTCILTGRPGAYTDFGNKSDGAKFHFTLAIAAGCSAQTALLFLLR